MRSGNYSVYGNANIRLTLRSEFYGSLSLSNLGLHKLTELYLQCFFKPPARFPSLLLEHGTARVGAACSYSAIPQQSLLLLTRIPTRMEVQADPGACQKAGGYICFVLFSRRTYIRTNTSENHSRPLN